MCVIPLETFLSILEIRSNELSKTIDPFLISVLRKCKWESQQEKTMFLNELGGIRPQHLVHLVRVERHLRFQVRLLLQRQMPQLQHSQLNLLLCKIKLLRCRLILRDWEGRINNFSPKISNYCKIMLHWLIKMQHFKVKLQQCKPLRKIPKQPHKVAKPLGKEDRQIMLKPDKQTHHEIDKTLHKISKQLRKTDKTLCKMQEPPLLNPDLSRIKHLSKIRNCQTALDNSIILRQKKKKLTSDIGSQFFFIWEKSKLYPKNLTFPTSKKTDL